MIKSRSTSKSSTSEKHAGSDNAVDNGTIFLGVEQRERAWSHGGRE